MNMVQQLGTDYFSQRFGGSFFLGPEGHPCKIENRRWRDDTSVPTITYTGTPEKPGVTEGYTPADYFPDMSILRTPRLGWRTAGRGKYLAHLSRNNTSYQRGVCPANLKRELAPHTSYLINYGEFAAGTFMSDSATALLIFNQKYLPLAEGIELLNAGKILAFAVSPAFAIVPQDEDTYAMLAHNRKVGTVSKSGGINLLIPFNPEMLESV